MLLENACHNLTSKRLLFRQKDSYIVSIPKSGRTWLRVLLHEYYSRLFGTTEALNSRDQYADDRPGYFFTHDRYEHLTVANPWQRLLGRFLIPADRRREGRILLIARDPRDVMVSLYFQNTRRVKQKQAFHGDISTMLQDPLLGVDTVIRTMNGWLREWGERNEGFLLSRYEDWQAEPDRYFGEIIAFLGDGAVDRPRLQQAIDESRFDKMQQRERSGAEGPSAVRPGNPDDPESFKARKGKVGGYREYLSDGDIAVIERAMTHLDTRFGYQP